MKNIKAIIEISRPLNLIITFSVVLVAAFISSVKFYLGLDLLFACISASFTAVSGYLINDYFDLEIDKINRPERPLPSKRISLKETLFFYVLSIVISISISFFVSLAAVIIVIITSLLLFIYSYKLKSIALAGNFVISICTGLAFIYGGIAVGNYKAAVIPAIFAIMINFVRELIKDIEDLEGDKKNNQSTFPIKYGINRTKNLIALFILLLIISTFYPFIFHIYSIDYFLVVLFMVDLPLVYFIKTIYSNDFLFKLSSLSFKLKLLMIIGLIAIFLGKH
jgi:geranylgeranylglycerol-phosphate geranylgeranyltransferase